MPMGFALTMLTTFGSATAETRSAKIRDIANAVLFTNLGLLMLGFLEVKYETNCCNSG
jgi:hypothetical protein